MPAAQIFLLIAALYGASGVMLGAFGAHGLRAHLGPGGLDTWQTAVLYHLIHALALLGAGLWLRLGGAAQGPVNFAGWCFVLGVLMFSGSLYLLALGRGELPFARVLGPVTPLGGLAFIAGWLALAWAAVRSTTS